MIETERLLLREYTIDDFDALYEIMSDAETMQHYPAPFDETLVALFFFSGAEKAVAGCCSTKTT